MKGAAAPVASPTVPADRAGRTWPLLRSLLLAGAALCAIAKLSAATDPNAKPPLVRVAITQAHFNGVNQTDAHAAMRVYFSTLSVNSGLDVALAPAPLEGVRDLAKALRNEEVDFLVMTTEEFLTVEDQGLVGPLLVSHVKQRFTEEYVLVTHADSAIRGVADLKGHSLIISSDVRSLLARRWLEVLCHEHGLPAPEQAFRKLTSAAKATQVVLPVFFRQADACVLTRHGFEIMAEMNPQVQKQLRILAVSRPLVPSLSCFRRGLSDARKQELLEATFKARGRPSFEQVMILFKSDGLLQQPVAVLDSARELLATHARIFGRRNGEPVGAPAADSATAGGQR